LLTTPPSSTQPFEQIYEQRKISRGKTRQFQIVEVMPRETRIASLRISSIL